MQWCPKYIRVNPQRHIKQNVCLVQSYTKRGMSATGLKAQNYRSGNRPVQTVENRAHTVYISSEHDTYEMITKKECPNFATAHIYIYFPIVVTSRQRYQTFYIRKA